MDVNDCRRRSIVDTGLETMTGGRIKRVASLLGRGSFCLTYGDGVADIDIRELIEFHKQPFRRTRFWKPMDTLRDKRELETLWASGSPPWKRW
jgi:NDP-sugar pyrophosphorylase family protein